MNDEDQDYFVLVIGALAAVLAVLAIVILLGTRLGIGVAADNGGVDFNGDDAAEAEHDDGAQRTSALVTLAGDSVTLEGVVGSEELRGELVARAEAAVGAANVTDNLVVDEGADIPTGVVTVLGEGSDGAVSALASEFDDSEDALGIDRYDNRLSVGEAAPTSEPPTTEPVPTTEAPATEAPELTPGAVTIDVSAGDTITLTGTVPDEATREALVARAAARVGEDAVDDQLVTDGTTTPDGAVITVVGAPDEGAAGELEAAYGDLAPWAVSVEAPPERPSLEVELEEVFALNPIQFEVASDVITAESRPTLDEAVALIQRDETLLVAIQGHTDSDGDEAANLDLSQSRANSVLAYLVDGGVDANRLTAEGFGETQLKIDPEATPEDKAQNRRIEWRVSTAS